MCRPICAGSRLYSHLASGLLCFGKPHVQMMEFAGSPCSDSDLEFGGIDAYSRISPARISDQPIPRRARRDESNFGLSKVGCSAWERGPDLRIRRLPVGFCSRRLVGNGKLPFDGYRSRRARERPGRQMPRVLKALRLRRVESRNGVNVPRLRLGCHIV
jgi:hypothetical protein